MREYLNLHEKYPQDMLLLADNIHLITVRDVDSTGALKITNLISKETISL